MRYAAGMTLAILRWPFSRRQRLALRAHRTWKQEGLSDQTMRLVDEYRQKIGQPLPDLSKPWVSSRR